MKSFSFVTCVALLLTGCAPTLAPHGPYLPILRSRGEVEARVSTGLAGSELQAGYQATSRLVLHAAFLNYGRSNTSQRFRSADLGLGYYYLLPNERWRLGLHAGLAQGAGTSGSTSCFECGSSGLSSTYVVRYQYAYAQPTVLFLDDKLTLGLGVRLGLARYQQLDEVRFDFLGDQVDAANYVGHQATFLQPVVQLSFRVLPWLALSTSSGLQFFVGPRNRLNDMQPLVGQVGLHLIVGKQPATQP